MPFKPIEPKAGRIRYERTRLSSSNRGYGDAAWKRFRSWILQTRPLCEDCGREFATEVHHIVKLALRPDLRLVPSNVLALDRRCHSKRTARGE